MDQYRRSPRATFLDYDNGEYFITICTHKMGHYFGHIEGDEMILNELGKFTDYQISRCNEFYPNLYIPLHVVMPNHIHILISIEGITESNDFSQRSPNPAFRENRYSERYTPSLSKYISSLKGVVKKYANAHGIQFSWQSRYHDHYIRGEKDRNKISEYIRNNILNWRHDCFYSAQTL